MPLQAGLSRTTLVPHAKQPKAQKTQQIQISKLAFTDAVKMVSHEGERCFLCKEDMNAPMDIVKLDCGHMHHLSVRSVFFAGFNFQTNLIVDI